MKTRVYYVYCVTRLLDMLLTDRISLLVYKLLITIVKFPLFHS